MSLLHPDQLPEIAAKLQTAPEHVRIIALVELQARDTLQRNGADISNGRVTHDGLQYFQGAISNSESRLVGPAIELSDGSVAYTDVRSRLQMEIPEVSESRPRSTSSVL